MHDVRESLAGELGEGERVVFYFSVWSFCGLDWLAPGGRYFGPVLSEGLLIVVLIS